MIPKPIIIYFLKTNDKEKILRATRGKTTLLYRRMNVDKDDNRFLVANNAS